MFTYTEHLCFHRLQGKRSWSTTFERKFIDGHFRFRLDTGTNKDLVVLHPSCTVYLHPTLPPLLLYTWTHPKAIIHFQCIYAVDRAFHVFSCSLNTPSMLLRDKTLEKCFLFAFVKFVISFGRPVSKINSCLVYLG